MPTEQLNTAPDALPEDARDAATPGAVLNDTDPDKTPGGGGLGGAAAAQTPDGNGTKPSGTSPNSPIDVPVPTGGTPPSAEAEARREKVADGASEPHPASQ